MHVEGMESQLLHTMLFAVVLFIVSYLPFDGIMKMIRAIVDLHDSPRNYSLLTIVMTSMWDTVLCLVAFIYAFKDQ